ncbi:MAG: hypothetical protein QM749_06380 [Aquabacterium sp.]
MLRSMNRSLALAALTLASLPAMADDTTLYGQFAEVTLLGDANPLPAGFTNVSLVESPINWQCDAGGVCAPTGDMKVSVVFASTSGQPVSITSQMLALPSMLVFGTAATLVDPNGQIWGTAAADVGKWSVGVNIVSQTPPAGDRQFASAYGQYNLSYWGHGVPPTAPSTGTNRETKVLGLNQIGLVTAGPGSTGQSLIDAAGLPIPIAPRWQGLFYGMTVQLDGARWAYPSSTDVHCSSLTCMDFQTGSIGVDKIMFTFDVALHVMSVPEAPTLPMMVLGMGALTWVARRRQIKG